MKLKIKGKYCIENESISIDVESWWRNGANEKMASGENIEYARRG